MRVTHHWSRNNVSARNLELSDLLARIIEYKSISHDSKFCECIIRIKRNGNMSIHATTRHHLYFQQLPHDLFSLPHVLWNTTPNTILFSFTQENKSELKRFLMILSDFDTSFSEISPDILELLTQFTDLEYHQNSTRATFFSDEVVSKSHTRRQREKEDYSKSALVASSNDWFVIK